MGYPWRPLPTEVSYVYEDKALGRGKGYGADAIMTLLRNVFEKTELTRLGLGTRKWNKRALRCYGKCGFVPCGESTMRMDDEEVRFTEMELEKDKFRLFCENNLTKKL